MSHLPVVVGLGEVLWDIYPEAPRLGGAPANFACHAACLGTESWIVGAVGTDALGDQAHKELAARHVRCGHLFRDPDHATGQVFVNLDASGSATYEIAADAAWDHLPWDPSLATLAARANAACFGSLAQRSAASRSAIQQFLAAMPRESLRVFDVNLRQDFHDRKTVLDSLALASAIKLNEDELPVVAGYCGVKKSSARDMFKEVVKRHDLRIGALTLGAKGSLLVTKDEVNSCAAAPTVLVDTVGAGDSFTAAVAVGLLQKRSLAEINRHANAVASFVCSQRGATPNLPARLRFKGNIHRS